MGKKGTSKYDGLLTEGQKFGKWTVLSPEILILGEARVRCKCDCGSEEKLVSVYNLMQGNSTACTICSHIKYGIDNPQWRGYKELPSRFCRKVKTKEDCVALLKSWRDTKGKCALTGWDISFSDGTASLDRIDSSKGYVQGNTQWVHINANVAKNGFDLEYFITLCHAIAQKHHNPNITRSKWRFGKQTKFDNNS